MKVIILSTMFLTLLLSAKNVSCFEGLEKDNATPERTTGSLLADVNRLINSGKCNGVQCNRIKNSVEKAIDPKNKGANSHVDAPDILHTISQTDLFNNHTVSDLGLRIRKEKLIDAFWHLGTAPLQPTSENGAKVTLETYLITSLAPKTSTYAPSSAAAYTTWLAYKKTCDKGECDPTLALRAGMITGATSLAIARADGLSTEGYRDPESVRRMIVGGALSGLIIAARGGDEGAIRRGIFHSAGFSLVRDRYRKIDAENSTESSDIPDIFCLNTVNPNRGCAATEAYMSYSEEIAQIEKLETIESSERYTAKLAQGTAWKPAEKIPAMRSLSLFDGQWFLDVKTKSPSDKNRPASTPSTLLTFNGVKPQVWSRAQEGASSEYSGIMQSTRKALEDLKSRNPQKETLINGTIAASLLCVNDNRSRHIVVEAPSLQPGNACRVLYQQGQTVRVPWAARYNSKFCTAKAVALTVKKIAQGWTCYAQ